MAKARKAQQLLTLRDLGERGLGRVAVGRMVGRGELVRVHRGVYARAGGELSEHHGLAVVAARSPKAVICLLSAAAFHHLGTQVPHEVWVALPPRTWAPVSEYPSVRVARFSGARYADGIEEHVIEGIRVRVYSAAKTVVDLFRYRNKLGLDVALEALREARRARRCTLDELTGLAARDGVGTAIRPYLESIG